MDDEKVAAVRRMVLSEQQFDQMVFGAAQRVVVEGGQRKVVVSSGSGANAGRQMESVLENEIRTVDTRCALTEPQTKKLQLAGRGDIARWQSRVSDLRRKCAGAEMDQEQYTAIMMELQSLRLAVQSGPFGEMSLLRKTLRKTLTDEQLTQFRALVRERAVQAVENLLRPLDASSQTKLVGEKRKKFIDTLVDQARLPETNNPYVQFIVMLEASRLEDQLKPLLNEDQWQTFRQQVNNARRMENMLRQSGQWPAPQAEDDETSH
jgi:hypothetical protein